MNNKAHDVLGQTLSWPQLLMSKVITKARREREMDFEWDEAKRQANFAKHDVDIFIAALIFEGPTIRTEDRRHDYGEVRYKSIGMVDDFCYVVIHTDRNGIIRLISAWEGGRRDRRKYQAGIAG